MHRRGACEARRAETLVRDGDEPAFMAIVEQHRRELHVHCYRMLGSFEDAEDLVQETFLRAWRKRRDFEGRASFRAWLYGIATHACLDALATTRRRAAIMGRSAGASVSPHEIPWLQPYPDCVLDAVAPRDSEPDVVAVARETIELAFLTAIQRLSPRQRAVLILRDVLDWSAKDTAELAGTSVDAVNGALKRARSTLRSHLPTQRLEWPAAASSSSEEQEVLDRYIEAHERADAEAVAALLGDDVRFTMPPEPTHYEGRQAVAAFFARTAFGPGSPGAFRLVPTRANRQPAAANYVRAHGDTVFRALSLDVLRIEGGNVAEITTFGPELFAAFGLPAEL